MRNYSRKDKSNAAAVFAVLAFIAFAVAYLAQTQGLALPVGLNVTYVTLLGVAGIALAVLLWVVE